MPIYLIYPIDFYMDLFLQNVHTNIHQDTYIHIDEYKENEIFVTITFVLQNLMSIDLISMHCGNKLKIHCYINLTKEDNNIKSCKLSH